MGHPDRVETLLRATSHARPHAHRPARSRAVRGPGPRLGGRRHASAAAQPPRGAARGGERAVPGQRPRALRLRRQPLPQDPAGGGHGALRRGRGRTARLRPARGHEHHPARRWLEPERPGPDRGDPGGRAPALRGDRRRGRGPPGARGTRRPARAREPGARTARPQARPRPGEHRHRHRRRRDRQQLGRHALRRDAGLLPDARLAHLRAPLGHHDRHRRSGRRGGVRRAASRSSPAA